MQNAGLSLGEEIEQRAAARGFGGLERLFGLAETHEEFGPQFVSRAGALEERRALILALDAAALRLVQRNRGLYIGKRLFDVALSGLDAGDDEKARGLDAGDDEKARGLAGRIADAAPQRWTLHRISCNLARLMQRFEDFAVAGVVFWAISLDFPWAWTRRVGSGLEPEFGAGRVCGLKGRL